MDIGLIISFAGVLIAALAGVLGVWMERDPDSPRTWGAVFSVLIVAASGVELVNTYDDTNESAVTDARLATVLEAMSELAAKGNNPALEQLVGAELAVQARANPEVVKKMEKSIEKKGGDPKAVTRQAAEGRRVAAGLPAQKPAAGERPVLAGGRSARGVRANDATGARTGKAAKARSAEGPAAGLGGPAGARAAGAAGAAAAKAGKAGKAAGAAAEAAGDAAETAGAAARQAGRAGKAPGAAADAAAKQADAAAKQADAAAKQADAAAKQADAAKKEADKAKDDAKKKGNAAADAVKGLGS